MSIIPAVVLRLPGLEDELQYSLMGFAGVVRFDGTSVEAGVTERLSSALSARTNDKIVTTRFANAVFLQRRREAPFGSQLSREAAGRGGGKTFFIGSGRLDNREELAAALGLGTAERADTPELLAGMLARWGDAGIARCLGAFSFAQWDGDARQLMLGRDCVGQRPLFFHCTDRFAVFSDILAVLLGLPEIPRELDEFALASFMAMGGYEPRRTLYRGIERTPSRSLVTIDQSGARHRIYWQPNLDAYAHLRSDDDYVEQGRELFDRAVMSATAGEGKVAISMSGGLDSSAVAATVAKLGRTERIMCYTNVALPDWQVDLGPDKYRDERDKVEALGRMYPQLELHFFAPTEPHPLYHDERRAFAAVPLPVLGPNEAAWSQHLRDAVIADGHSSLLVGARGNMGLSWNGRCSLLALLYEGDWQRLAHEIVAVSRESQRSVGRVVANEILLPAGPEWLRRLTHRLRGRDPDDLSHYCALNPSFVAEHKLLARWRERGHDNWFGHGGWRVRRMRIERMFDNAAPGRDRSGAEREMGGLELRDPHADRRVLEFALAVPEPLYRRNGVHRSFARALFADRLPDEILREQRSGAAGGGPWFRMLDARRQEFAAELERFESSALAKKLLDLPRLKRLLDDWPKDEHCAQRRQNDYKLAFPKAMHIGRFIKWVEGGNG